MRELVENSLFFGVLLSLGAYCVGLFVQKKLKHVLFNPLLIAILLVIGVLVVGRIEYDTYFASARYLSYLLTPATVCLAIPLYEQFELLRKYPAALLCGILAGALTSLCSVLALALLFRLPHADYVTLLPKSVTSAIGMGLSEKLGGYPSLTVAAIILSGILGNMFAGSFCKLCHIGEPIARGVAIGSASHAIGTAKAMEMGEIEGAMSSLSIVLSGIVTVIFAGIFASFQVA